ncbi:MAG: universal stress protein [Epsilonproteobacteria bacterium]|nr:universal stress protein [Campylobacterota bacterium]
MNSQIVICIVKGGKIGEKAAEKAIGIAKENSMKLIFLFSSDTDDILSGNFGISSDGTTSRGIENIGKTLIGQFKDKAKNSGVKCSSEIVGGDLLDELRKMIERDDKSILVVPRLERGPIEKFLIGNNIDDYVNKLKEEFPLLKIHIVDG